MKLTYFPFYGRAEPIRMLLSHKQIPYEEETVSFPDFAKLKSEGKLPFNQLPILEFEGRTYGQVRTMVRFLGKKHGYYPEDAYAAYLADAMLDSLEDLIQKITKPNQAKDDATKKELFTKLVGEELPQHLKIIDRLVSEGGDSWHCVGYSMTVADFHLGALITSFITN